MVKAAEALRIVDVLDAAPLQFKPVRTDASDAVWCDILRDVSLEAGMAAARRWIAQNDRYPSGHQLRETAKQLMRQATMRNAPSEVRPVPASREVTRAMLARARAELAERGHVCDYWSCAECNTGEEGSELAAVCPECKSNVAVRFEGPRQVPWVCGKCLTCFAAGGQREGAMR